MTPERIAELRALADAATPGPWSDVWTNEPACYVVAGSYPVSQFIGRPPLYKRNMTPGLRAALEGKP